MIRAASLQMVSGSDLVANLHQAEELLRDAALQGAKLAVLPENFALVDTHQMLVAGRDEAETHKVQSFLREQAVRHKIWIVGGSTPCASRPDGSLIENRVRSTCWVIDANGEVAGRYDKIHLFDVSVDDAQGQYQESRLFEPGSDLLVLETPFGRLGVAICYDLRFPEMFRRFQDQGADIVALPAAFTKVTGAAHWHVLLRARAIENQCFVIACGQGGKHSEQRETFGHSMLVDPWGIVLAERDTGPGAVIADLDVVRLEEVRRRMPVRDHRRL